MGSNKGVNAGDVFSVVRPRGQVESRWTKKDVGIYVEEVGALEVVEVKAEVSVAKVISSCEAIMLGDLVQVSERRTNPLAERRAPLDLFADPTGKAQGRILMSRDGAEMLARDYVAYVDLGADENVRAGDRMTIFRKLGKGNLFKYPEEESLSARDEGYQSRVYRGGKFNWGLATDALVPADFDGDGKADVAVYRGGIWYLRQTTGAVNYAYFGLGSDTPTNQVQLIEKSVTTNISFVRTRSSSDLVFQTK